MDVSRFSGFITYHGAIQPDTGERWHQVCRVGSEKAPRIRDVKEVNMRKTQKVTGPVAPGQYGAMQVSGPGAYYPLQTTDWASMFSAMMLMIMMMAIIMPMLKGVTGSSKS